MSEIKNTALRALAVAAFVELLAGGTASAATLAHHAGTSAATAVVVPVSETEPARARPAADPAAVVVGGPARNPARNCTRGHLSHGHC